MLGKLLKNRGIRRLYIVFAIIAAVVIWSDDAYAEDAIIHFGSETYFATQGEGLPIGVYINTANGVGHYEVTVKYDPTVMQYVSGADGVDPEQGILTFVGESGDNEVKYMVNFNTISGNNTAISFASADIRMAETGEAFNVAVQGAAPIGVTPALEEEAEVDDGRIPMGVLRAEEMLIPDLTVPEIIGPKDRYASDESIERKTGEGGSVAADDEEDLEQTNSILYNSYFLFVLLFIALVITIQIVATIIIRIIKRAPNKEKKKEKLVRRESNFESGNKYLNVMDLDRDSIDIIQQGVYDFDASDYLDQPKGLQEPVIEVDDVTMEFHIASSQASGLKDYLIQLLKRQITYRKLYALYHVSFNVYRGEIVGIIGTNGSGKSTLLKIVSGALHPTEGEVRADRKKIQLLTLGTGFDMELTGKENVYLNGAIIGYSKKFLDEHYDEIVEFAELQDFMDEKVKNYSSGMVSRLGFAIATAGDAAEILILDEVLSVGDEFFRKKSLKRVKEMIHGGSTVLLVSHSMQTILDNCTKCVWIEKGELRMVDEPKVVCDAYSKMKENEAG